MLLGLVRPDAGEVLLLGRRSSDPRSRGAGRCLPELFRYQPWLTATEVLDLHVRLARVPVPAAERRECLELVGLTARSGDRVGAFSKGMQQRLGLAVALVARPELVVLDEPTSALDPLGRVDVRDLVLSLKSRGVAVLLNSHLIGEVERVCDRVVILDKGRVAASGTLAELLGQREVRLRLAGVDGRGGGQAARVRRDDPRAATGSPSPSRRTTTASPCPTWCATWSASASACTPSSRCGSAWRNACSRCCVTRNRSRSRPRTSRSPDDGPDRRRADAPRGHPAAGGGGRLLVLTVVLLALSGWGFSKLIGLDTDLGTMTSGEARLVASPAAQPDHVRLQPHRGDRHGVPRRAHPRRRGGVGAGAGDARPSGPPLGGPVRQMARPGRVRLRLRGAGRAGPDPRRPCGRRVLAAAPRRGAGAARGRDGSAADAWPSCSPASSRRWPQASSRSGCSAPPGSPAWSAASARALGNEGVARVGTVSRILLPTDGLWRGAMHAFQDPSALAPDGPADGRLPVPERGPADAPPTWCGPRCGSPWSGG